MNSFETLHNIAIAVNNIGNARGRNDKLALLKSYENLPGFKRVMKFIYNPYCKTGISSAKMLRAIANNKALQTTVFWPTAIDYFTKHTTGSDRDIAVAAAFYRDAHAYSEAAGAMAYAIVTQDLKIGVTATSLNAAYGASFIPKVGCMLGIRFGDVPPSRITWPCIVTEKLDGVRRVLIKENGVVKVFSRSGHEDTGLIEIVDEARWLPDNYVYDGELLAKGTFKNCIAQRQATNSIANSKGVKTGLTFNVFDMVPVEEFYRGQSSAGACERKIRLGATLMDEGIKHIDPDWFNRIKAFGIYRDLEFIKPVPVLAQVRTLREAEPIVEKIWAAGGEGIMLNTFDGKYEIKRSRALLKVKHTEEHVLTVVDLQEGSGKYENAMGALICQYEDSTGQQVFLGVGSGFTDREREIIWENRDSYIGRKIEVECFGESTNSAGSKSLSCPIFKRFVGCYE